MYVQRTSWSCGILNSRLPSRLGALRWRLMWQRLVADWTGGSWLVPLPDLVRLLLLLLHLLQWLVECSLWGQTYPLLRHLLHATRLREPILRHKGCWELLCGWKLLLIAHTCKRHLLRTPCILEASSQNALEVLKSGGRDARTTCKYHMRRKGHTIYDTEVK